MSAKVFMSSRSFCKSCTLTIIDAKKQLDRNNDKLNLVRLDIQNHIKSTKVTALKTIHSKVSVSIDDDVFKTPPSIWCNNTTYEKLSACCRIVSR